MNAWDLDAVRAADTPQKLLLEAARVGGWPAPAARGLGEAPGTLEAALGELYAVRAAAGLDDAPALEGLPTLDHSVERPLAGLVGALAQAVEHWRISRADLTQEDLAVLADENADPVDLLAASQKIRGDHMLAAALLVLDAADLYSPQLRAAAEAGAWPEEGFVDPAGHVELGTVGNDNFTEDRWLHVDPAGDDTYTSNAGGSGVFYQTVAVCTPGVVVCARWSVVDPFTVIPIALAIDQGGNDRYLESFAPGRGGALTQGAGQETVGVLRDEAGDDYYHDCARCQGFGRLRGVGLIHDPRGNDFYEPLHSFTMGSGLHHGLGILFEEAGDDTYFPESGAKGSGDFLGVGVFRDLGGSEVHSETGAGNYGCVSWLPYPGVALFYDSGGQIDDYGPMADYPPYPRNDDRWDCTYGPLLGRGIDE